MKGGTWNSLLAAGFSAEPGSRMADALPANLPGKGRRKLLKLSCSVNRRIRDPNVRWCEGSGITGETFADSVGLNLNRYSLPLDCVLNYFM